MIMNTSKVIKSLALLSTVSIFLVIVRIISFNTFNYWYLCWNLILGLIPLGLVILLSSQLSKRPWASFPMLLLTVAYIGFLPNSFYMATDFIHMQYASSQTIIFDIVMILLFTLSGLLSGFTSVYIIHKELIRRIGSAKSSWIVSALLLLCSFALYLGRYLHWNTWDVIANPAGIIFDVSDRIVNPLGSSQLVSTILLFFILLGSVYAAIWNIIAPQQTKTRHK